MFRPSLQASKREYNTQKHQSVHREVLQYHNIRVLHTYVFTCCTGIADDGL